MAPPLLTLSEIALTFGSTPLIENASLMVYPRERLCLVGRNGSGKSTLMKIAAGLVEHDSGERFVKPGTSWRYLPQEPDLSAFATSRDYIADGLVGADDGGRIPYLLDALGLTGDEDPKVMSGGEMRRAALARTLAPDPDILMLDEPTNHLDLPAIEWLEEELARSQSAIILISHDRRFLESLSRRTVWMDRGETRDLDKGFAHFEDWRDDFLEQEELERHKMERKVHREQHWVVHGVSGRRKRNVRRLKELGTLRETIKNQRKVKGNAQITVTEANNSSKQIVRMRDVSHRFGERPIVTDLSLRINRGERLGLVGPNGAGKTTLLKIIMGDLVPDEGQVELGLNLESLVIDQKRESLDPEWTLKDALTDGGNDTVIVGGNSVHVMRYMKDFLFLPEQARTPLHALSGGERGRLQLARGLRLPSNFLVLDEPTNDLDLETLDLLQEMVANYNGTVIIVSHDRDFLDRTVTRTLAYEGPGEWQIYPGGYSDMMAQRGVGVQARKSKTESKKSGASQTAAPKKSSSKLSYKHKFRLEQLPKEMETLSAQIETLETKMADPNFYTKDPDGFTKASTALQKAQSDLEAAEEEWLELEMLREEAEG
ncbi:ATP-binding cassette subfamily F protein uup [Litorimonas taeanensis]|uniref:ATP-binding cassette subfamily F protein uup n=1 Tax=Litorimonas taeanensis TaxID=568099 RepID=A0A420WLD7_9PROT|nr:ATP-binding cassette domain-containing protein [Litorimonas taeanensis]RKQ71800.1 ATP-binding cassette subfamily F protein uup [Litorimonas taeanensis]